LDNEIYLLVMIRDVSLRQKRIAELKKLSRAVEQSPASVVITNTKGDIEYVNPKFTEVTGFSSEEAIGQNPKVLKSGLQGPEIYKEMWDTISAKKEWRGEFHNRKKNGELFWEFASISPVLDDNGDISHYIAVKEDITQRKELEEKLNNSYRKLELLNKNLESRIIAEVGKNREKDQLILHQSRNAQMGELLSMIAHQWRQPLNAISTAMIDLSLKNAMGETSQEKIAELASFVEKTTQKLSRTIDDFMDFYHSDQKKALFHLKSVFDNVLNLMGSQLQASGVTVANNFDENLKLFGCQNMFEQVLINFLANSREAYLNYPADDKTISMTVSENQDEVRLMIEDKAGGIETNIIERIFDPYFTTKEKKSGTGNGLYMSKTIIENNFNGSVLVENTATGAKFTLILPKKQST
ncbi:MAG: PAS domain S-box protein, partial [Deltaproteobacteria bacterium]|nr:PAS domain S-box protein [Deltaproteobacteria bacterium]